MTQLGTAPRPLGTAADTGAMVTTVISRVEQLVGTGDTLIIFGGVTRRVDGSTIGRLTGVGTVRLDAGEREALIHALINHRTPDTNLPGTNGG